MARILHSRAALQDFRDIISDLANRANGDIAARYSRDIEAAIDLIGTRPGIGTPRSKLGRRTRMLVVHPYLIFYEGEPKGEDILVLRIVHGRRRIGRKLIDEGRNG